MSDESRYRHRLLLERYAHDSVRALLATLTASALVASPLAAISAESDDTPQGTAEASETTSESEGEQQDETSADCPGHVPPDRRGNAKKLTLLGVQCFKTGQHARAYTYYRRAFDESESDLLVAAMGRSLHELGLFHLSRDYYRQFLSGKEKGEGTEKIEKRLDQLEEDVASTGRRVELHSYPSGVRIQTELANGEWVVIGETPATVELREGTHRLAFDRPNYHRETRELEVESGDSPQTVDVGLVHERSVFDATANQWKRWGLITGLGSLPALGVGSLFLGLMNSKFRAASNYEPGIDGAPASKNILMAQGYRHQRWGIAFLTLGGVAAITGAGLFLRGKSLEPSSSDDGAEGDESDQASDTDARGASRRVALQPLIGPGIVGLKGRF